MKLFLILSLAAVLSANPTNSGTREFLNLVTSLSHDYLEDMEEILDSEQVYLDALNRNEEVSYSGIELLTGEEEELEDEPINDEEDQEEESDSGEPDISNLPEVVDSRDKGIMHIPIWQGMCGSCGWVSGTQTLEARIAFISENYVPYSIQNFMNCAGKPCVGAQPYSVTTQLRKSGFAVPEQEVPYTKRKCVNEGTGKSACYAKCGRKNPANFSNALEDQFVIIAGTRAAHSEAQLMQALQEGPVTTCFSKKKSKDGERCSPGCSHANSIIGYDPEKLLVQESYGRNWGKDKNGTWKTTRGSICAKAIIKKAYYPKIFYDYGRANGYYTAIEGGVSKEELQFVDKEKFGITANNTRNWGTAKNKCAFLGSACKGVVRISEEEVELVANFGAGSSGDLSAFKKFQMVSYLKHEGSGKYIGIKKNKKGLHLVTVDKVANAAPFFSSYARFISFQYPNYHLVNNKLEEIVGGLKDIDVMKSWTLNGCNIYNDVSGLSFDQVLNAKSKKMELTSNKYDATSSTQKFNVGLSGSWMLISSDSGLPYASKGDRRIFTDDSKASVFRLRWNARQIITKMGRSYNSDMKIDGDFDFEKKEHSMRPRDCAISRLIPLGFEDNLAVENGKLVMSSETESRWTLEYADL